MSEEVKAAAERVRRYFDAQDSNDEEAVFSGLEVACYYEDLRKLARCYLADNPADDEEPIDEAWLRSVGFTENFLSFSDHKSYRFRNVYCDAYACAGPKRWNWILRHYSHEVKTDPTCGDVRRLTAALGLELKGSQP